MSLESLLRINVVEKMRSLIRKAFSVLYSNVFVLPFILISFLSKICLRKQSGAVEACWAHNPEVRRSKLRSATNFSILF